ncbi:MAG TPA: Ni/Fe hydrogenase subunit alpha [Planctomycetota bacterium]|jgi:F420-non-reducing hydrogenase large subunit
MKQISIDPMTRLEGHGRIEIFLDDEGSVSNVYFQVPELRGFEQFCVGRQAEDMPLLTSRICGVCPEAHLMAATKALDRLFNVDPPPTAKKLRELLYSAFFVTDHTTHFYALGGPDFIVGPDAPPGERNILGVLKKAGNDVGRSVLQTRARNHAVIKIIGGREIHPTGAVPGGWAKSISEIERQQIEAAARENITFALFTLELFNDLVLKNPAYREMVLSDVYLHRTYYMGMVDSQNRSNFYDGQVRVVSPEGKEVLKYDAADYAQHVAERVEPWTYLKFPYLKKIGWKGFTDGADSGVYCATPLSRLNVSDSLATPRAQKAFEKFYETFGSKRAGGRFQPVHHRLATHWARLIELLYAAERMLELSCDPEITCPFVRVIPSGKINPAGGIGCVEAPRGTLTHHYQADERGVLTKANLIVGTTNNHAAMAMSLRRAAEQLIRKGQVVSEGVLNRIEMAFRLYDPCLSCATHAIGQMPLQVIVRDSTGKDVRQFSQNIGTGGERRP